MKDSLNFNFHLYTEIVFGKGSVGKLAELVKKYGGTKVLFVYGSGSIKKSGLYDHVKRELDAGAIPFVELGGVKANPLRSLAEKGMELARAEGTDFYLGVGGGSVIDTAKAIALAMANDGEYWPFYHGTEPPRMAPVGSINTIAAAGSETSGSTVLVDDLETGDKSGLMWPAVCRPVFAIMDPELTYSVSAKQTVAGAADIFSHTYMRFFSKYDSYIGDEYCIATLRTVKHFAPIARNCPSDYEARAELMLSAAFSHNDLTEIGRPHKDMGGEHTIERQLSGRYDFPHGEGLAVIMPAYLKYIVAHGTAREVGRVATFGARVFDAGTGASAGAGTGTSANAGTGASANAGTGTSASAGTGTSTSAGTGTSTSTEFGASAGAETKSGVNTVATEEVKVIANEGIKRFTEWLRALGLPTTLAELGVPEDKMDAVAEYCVKDTGGNIRGFMNLDANAIREIFTLAR
ncbi:MAG: iron-containing alcohol dehydrogenase [Clostridiales Family XIII bacterium]|jgi:alcohol dehydrogenase YqhD (iron-dependent ADH family)|nr:iron-containing alcohol dehydrogenase [Clostridiales Family XIII bacterium]